MNIKYKQRAPTHKKLSMAFILALSCIGIALLPIMIYSVLSMSIFGRGLDAITKANLIKYIQDYATVKNIKDKKGIDIFENKITITNNYDTVPKSIRSVLPKDIKDDYLYHLEIKTEAKKTGSFFCLVAIQIEGEKYYAYQNIPKDYAESFIKPQAIQTLYILAGTGIVILIFLFIFTKILIKKYLSQYIDCQTGLII